MPEKQYSTTRTQRNRILGLLIAGFRQKRPVPLPEIMAIAAQYNARILELRRLGWNIQNKNEFRDGKRLSWFSLLSAIPSTVTPERAQRSNRPLPSVASPQAEQPALLDMPAQPQSWADPEAQR